MVVDPKVTADIIMIDQRAESTIIIKKEVDIIAIIKAGIINAMTEINIGRVEHHLGQTYNHLLQVLDRDQGLHHRHHLLVVGHHQVHIIIGDI
jgi:hypothetical protein